jgi:hypothetical protein
MIVVNLTKAKGIAHDMRRAKRAEEFAPHDEVIMKQIPGAAADAAEASRAEIRAKYATVQTNIDSAADVDALKSVVEGM